jgi:hypothetical protein
MILMVILMILHSEDALLQAKDILSFAGTSTVG